MTWAAVVGGVVAAGGAAYSASQQAGAAGDAAGAQMAAAGQQSVANIENQRLADARAAQYLEGGGNAYNQLMYLMGLGDPTKMAKVEGNFDKDAYRNWLVQQKTEELQAKYTKPSQQATLQKQILAQTAAIDKNLEKMGAWNDYQRRIQKRQNVEGDFWQTREGVAGAPGAPGSTGYGFLQQRFNNQIFERDPGYQWRMDEGARAVEGSAAARGGLLSGAAAKAMQKYGQGYASNEYQNAFSRFNSDQQNLYNRLSNIAGMGQQQMNTQNAMHSNTTAANNAALMGAANAQAAGIMGAANARSSGYQGMTNALMSGIGSYAANNSGFASTGQNSPFGGNLSDGLSDYDLGQKRY